MRQLGNGEHKHQVEEQLHRTDPRVGMLARVAQIGASRHGRIRSDCIPMRKLGPYGARLAGQSATTRPASIVALAEQDQAARLAFWPWRKIGRAACRARVCQYV